MPTVSNYLLVVARLDRQRLVAFAWRAGFMSALCALLSGIADLAVAQTSVEPLSIGVSLPLSGANEREGRALLAGAQACLAGQKVGKGRPVVLQALDDGGQAGEAVKHLRTLAADPKVLAVLGTWGAEATEAALPVLAAARLPMVGPVTGSEAVRASGSRYVFHVRAGLADEAARIVVQLDHQGLNDIAVVHTEDALGREGLAAVQLEMNRLAMRPVSTSVLTPGGENFEDVVRKVSASRPDAVIVIARSRPAAAFMRRWTANGFRASLAVFSETNAAALHEALGKAVRGVAASQVWPSPWGANRALVRDYQAAMLAATAAAAGARKPFGYASLEGCINAMVVLKALQRAGQEPTRDSVLTALESNAIELDEVHLKYGRQDRRGGRFAEMTVMTADGDFRR